MAERMQNTDRITPELRAWLLAELRFPVMATISADGMPSQSVIWFDIEPDRDDTIILNTLRGRLKDRHLRRDPRMSLCFEDGTDYVTIQGVAEVSDDPARGDAEIAAMARRYGKGDDSYAHGERVPIRVRVQRVIRHT